MIATRYGLHTAGGIPFLHQRGVAANLISPNLYSPFQLHITPRNTPCPHQFNLDEASDERPEWLDEPLARAFLPTPRGPTDRAVWVHDPDDQFAASLAALERLSSPTMTIARPIWWRKAIMLRPEYTITNLGPVVWTAAGVQHCRDADRHIELGEAERRRVVIVAKDRLPLFTGIDEVQPFHVPPAPYEQIGAGLLRDHMMEIMNGPAQTG